MTDKSGVPEADTAIRRLPQVERLIETAQDAVREWRLHGQLTDSCRHLEAALAALVPPPGLWQSIESAPRQGKALFWLRPRTQEEATVADTSGTPIVAYGDPYLKMCEYGWWSVLEKATHWMPLPVPPPGRLLPSDTAEDDLSRGDSQ